MNPHMPSERSAESSAFEAHQILTTEEAAKFCGYSLSRWRALYGSGAAPKPIRFSARKNGWKVGDLARWIDSKVEA